MLLLPKSSANQLQNIHALKCAAILEFFPIQYPDALIYTRLKFDNKPRLLSQSIFERLYVK